MSVADDELGKTVPRRSKYRAADNPIDTLAGLRAQRRGPRIHEEHVEREARDAARHGNVSSWIRKLAFSADGRRIVSESADNEIRLWGTPRRAGRSGHRCVEVIINEVVPASPAGSSPPESNNSTTS